tara:strand:+ start:5159 stop:5611 length:453 start_codon:yes stop_codon:yes gene_type:complete
MIKTIIKAIYSAFISIVLISLILALWTSYSFVFQSSKSSEIAKVLQNMYASQMSVVVNVIDLSKILIKNTSESITSKNDSFFLEKELLKEKNEEIQLDQSSNTEDNGDNPFGIVIQPSLSEAGEKRAPEISEETEIENQSDLSVTEMEIH